MSPSVTTSCKNVQGLLISWPWIQHSEWIWPIKLIICTPLPWSESVDWLIFLQVEHTCEVYSVPSMLSLTRWSSMEVQFWQTSTLIASLFECICLVFQPSFLPSDKCGSFYLSTKSMQQGNVEKKVHKLAHDGGAIQEPKGPLLAQKKDTQCEISCWIMWGHIGLWKEFQGQILGEIQDV